MLKKGRIPKQMEGGTNRPYNKTWQRKQYGSIQVSPDKSAQHWRENIRETAYQ
jgi:hypothetical protein